jgi:hypothetical protein
MLSRGQAVAALAADLVDPVVGLAVVRVVGLMAAHPIRARCAK